MKTRASITWLVLVVASMANANLLEMSQTLWTKLLSGGLAKVGSLDPLRVPVIKVDQSEGDTSYRIVLRNVEITGLNASSLDSVHVARGRLKSNLSEFEAGYVSYSDLRNLDTIRYRFHTLVKESKNATSDSTGRRDGVYFQKTDTDQQKYPNGNSEFRIPSQGVSQSQGRYGESFESQNFRFQTEDRRPVELRRGQPAQTIFAQSPTSEERFGQISRTGSIKSGEFRAPVRGGDAEEYPAKEQNPAPSASQNVETKSRPEGDSESDSVVPLRGYGVPQMVLGKAIVEGEAGERVGQNYGSREQLRVGFGQGERRFSSGGGQGVPTNGAGQDFGADRFNEDSDSSSRYTSTKSGAKLEQQPGYVDILYADNEGKEIKHFGNLRIDASQETRVYGFRDIMKDIRESMRYIVHNFTEGESLEKRNDKFRAAIETKRIKDLVRYARMYQEKDGYFEQGMQLIYHLGDLEGEDPKINEAKRKKRQHSVEDVEVEDDVMHVIVRVHVPKLNVKAGYTLTGKVDQQVVRGNGLLSANFTDLIGDFTVELKKINEDQLIVRAARAKLVARDRKVNLQGMDQKGPVDAILVHGLMAAEAVAAMLADDFASKALTENSADAMIYKMYKDLPVN